MKSFQSSWLGGEHLKLYPETIHIRENIEQIDVVPRTHEGQDMELYIAFIEDGIVKVAKTPKTDVLPEPKDWEYLYELGPGKDVAIEFNGHWEQIDRGYELITEEEPWVFILRNDNNLYAIKGVDEILLAEGVTNISCIRGWKNVLKVNDDHGIIVSYIRDSNLYYRNYAVQPNGTVMWVIETEVIEFTGGVTNCTMFRTNDYRIGFLVVQNGQIKLALSHRNWVGMGVRENYISLGIVNYEIDLIEIIHHTSSSEDNIMLGITNYELKLLWGTPLNFVSIENFSIPDINEELEEFDNYGKRIRIFLDHDIHNIVSPAGFTVFDANNVNFPVLSLAEGNTPRDLVIEVMDFNFANGDLTVSYDNAIGAIQGEAGQVVNNFAEIFTPIGLIAPTVSAPEVEVIWNE